MDTKFCSTCSLTKSLSSFYKRKTHRSGQYYERCKDCSKERGRRYYHQNQKKQLILAKIRKQRYINERKEWINELKRKPCMDCGKIYPPWVMDFDHREGMEKIGSISSLAIHNTSSFLNIKKEIEKCDLVCSNCHRDRTHTRLVKNAAVAKLVTADV